MSEIPKKSTSSFKDRIISDEELAWLGAYVPKELPPIADSTKTADTGNAVKGEVKKTINAQPEKK